jgi:hypothetical protein
MSPLYIAWPDTVTSRNPLENRERLAAIARLVDGKLNPSGEFVHLRCPAHDDLIPSCSVWIDPRTSQVRVKCFAGCPEQAVLALLKVHGVSVDAALVATAAPNEDLTMWRAENAGYDQHIRENAGWRRAEQYFNAAAPLQPGDLGDRYLRGRGIDLDRFPAALRLHPRLWHAESQQHLPAMVAKVSAPVGTLRTAHRTWLNRETAEKASVEPVRKLCSTMRGGGAVRLFDPGGDQLLLAEGIETTLAALVLAGWSLTGWATVSALGMARLHVPWRFRRVVIGADHDRAGLDAARALARLLRAEGRQADIRPPATSGDDWNDELRRRLAQRRSRHD